MKKQNTYVLNRNDMTLGTKQRLKSRRAVFFSFLSRFQSL